MKLIHGKSGRGARPMGFPCTFVKPEGGVCGEVFERNIKIKTLTLCPGLRKTSETSP